MPGIAQDEPTPISSLATISQVREALEQTDLLAFETQRDLEQQLAKAAAAASDRAETLSNITDLANTVSSEAEELAALLSSASQTSESACVRIRQLDVVLTRAQSALSWAEDILTLRVCAEGAKTSLSAGDLASAARHVATYRKLSQPVRDDPASTAGVAQLTQSIAELSRKVRASASTNLSPDAQLSTAEAIDAVRLYVPIGLSEDGLSALTDYLTQRVARESDADVRSLIIDAPTDAQPTGMDEPHIVALARLFESVAAHIHDCEPFMLELFGATSTGTLINVLQKQCDSCADRILTRFKEARGVDEVLRAIRSETANARDLDAFLNELALLSQRVARYFDFLRGKGELPEDTDVSEEDRISLRENVTSSMTSCGLAKLQKELSGHYTTIETYFMRENARLAIKIDESNGDDAETSTAVDDFFFVLQKCFQRAFAFGDTECDVLRVALQQISLCLMNDLLPYIRRRLRETEPGLEKMFGVSASTSALPAAGLAVSYLTEFAKANISIPGQMEEEGNEGDIAKYDFFTALNNASVSADYATRLRGNVEKAMQASKQLLTDDRAILATPVAQMTDAARALVLAGEHGVSRLASIVLGRVTNEVEDSLQRAAYIVSEAEYALDSDATPSFSRELAQDIETKVLSAGLEQRLTEKNWDALVRQVAEWFANKMETTVFLPSGMSSGKSFNAFGGLRADRDVRAISSYFSGKSKQSTVRDVFGRLSQFAMLVNLERPAEIYDMWGPNAGGMTWRLSPGEVRRTLALRTDFNQDTVRSLKL